MPAIHKGSPTIKFPIVASKRPSVLSGLPAIEALAQGSIDGASCASSRSLIRASARAAVSARMPSSPSSFIALPRVALRWLMPSGWGKLRWRAGWCAGTRLPRQPASSLRLSRTRNWSRPSAAVASDPLEEATRDARPATILKGRFPQHHGNGVSN